MKCVVAYILTSILCHFLGTVSCKRIVNITDYETWKPSEEMKRDLPAYIMGYDYDGRPVYVIELGKWDLLKYLVDVNETTTELIYRRTEFLWSDGLLNSEVKSKVSEDGCFVIMDMAGFNQRVLLYPEVVKLQLWNMGIMEDLDEYIGEIFIINSNFVVETWLQLVKPVAGRVLGRAVVISMDSQKVAATLRQKIPRDQLPPYYGGYGNFTPVAIL